MIITTTILHIYKDYGADSPIALPPPVLLDQISIIRSPTVSIQELRNILLDDANKDKYYTIQCKVKDINEGWCYIGYLNCPRKVKMEERKSNCWSSQLLPTNHNLKNSANIDDENSPIGHAADVITDDMTLADAKKTLGKRKKTSIQGISASDPEDQE
ncbi:hypothetical protein LINPERHAP2_LOCUS6076 [Linum perenne]